MTTTNNQNIPVSEDLLEITILAPVPNDDVVQAIREQIKTIASQLPEHKIDFHIVNLRRTGARIPRGLYGSHERERPTEHTR